MIQREKIEEWNEEEQRIVVMEALLRRIADVKPSMMLAAVC